MVIEKDTILYFSGTGNSFQVAKDIGSELGEVEVSKVTSFAKEEEIIIKAKTLGIVFPVYYARLPLIVDKVIRKLNIDKDTYVFAIATYGGAPAGILNKLNNILKEKDKVLNSGFLLNMPGNYILSYGAASLRKQNKIFKNEQKRVKEISDIIKERKGCKLEASKLVIDRVIDKLLIKTTDKIMDKLYIEDTGFWTNDKCNGCKSCERICPVKNIEFISGKPTWNHRCELCMACIQYCPKEAIQWKNKTIKRKRYKNPNINFSELTSE